MIRGKTNRTMNAGTFTPSMFWAMIRAALRQKSRWWKPIAQCKANSRRLYKGPLKRQKYEYQCNKCKKWFPDKEIAVDHIVPCGQLNCAEDLPRFVTRLFCEVEGFQVLCESCHSVKTEEDKLLMRETKSTHKKGRKPRVRKRKEISK